MQLPTLKAHLHLLPNFLKPFDLLPFPLQQYNCLNMARVDCMNVKSAFFLSLVRRNISIGFRGIFRAYPVRRNISIFINFYVFYILCILKMFLIPNYQVLTALIKPFACDENIFPPNLYGFSVISHLLPFPHIIFPIICQNRVDHL